MRTRLRFELLTSGISPRRKKTKTETCFSCRCHLQQIVCLSNLSLRGVTATEKLFRLIIVFSIEECLLGGKQNTSQRSHNSFDPLQSESLLSAHTGDLRGFSERSTRRWRREESECAPKWGKSTQTSAAVWPVSHSTCILGSACCNEKQNCQFLAVSRYTG